MKLLVSRAFSVLTVLLISLSSLADPIPSRVVAYTGQVAPGTNGATFLILYPPGINAKGNIAFRARITPASTNNDDGIWTERDQVLRLYLRQGDPTPISGEIWGRPGHPNINDAGLNQFGRLVFVLGTLVFAPEH